MPIEVPRNLIEFTRMFPDEEACIKYLMLARWADGFVCDKCAGTDGYWIESRRAVECKSCGRQNCLTSGTIMHRTRTPLQVWFYGCFLATTLTPGISALQFQSQVGISRYETAFQMLHKIRSAMVNPNRDRLHGIVEVDETYVGGEHKGAKPGRGDDSKAIVIVAVEVRTKRTEDKDEGLSAKERMIQGFKPKKMYAGRIRARVIPDASAEALTGFIQETVDTENTVVVTDGWLGYSGLEELGYTHSVHLSSKDDGKGWLTMAHLEIANFKAQWLGTYHGRVEQSHLQNYLNQFAFVHNRRFLDAGVPFLRVLQLGMAIQAPTYAQMYDPGKFGENVHKNPAGAII